MKKILSFLLAGVAALGLIGCSGDLHDDVIIDPNAMTGNWFYYELDTSTVTGDTIAIIFNAPGKDMQTKDITGVAKTGTVAYVWVAKTKADVATVSTRTDCPDKKIGNSTDKLGIYVFTDSPLVSLWAWDETLTTNNLTGGSWPGVAMNTDVAIVVEEWTCNLTFKVSGATEGDYFYINGSPWNWGGDWPFAAWNGGDAEKTAACLTQTARFATAGADGTATFAEPVAIKVTKGQSTSPAVKVVNILGEDPTAYTAGTIDYANGEFTVTPVKDTNYLVTIDVSSGSSYAVTVAEQ